MPTVMDLTLASPRIELQITLPMQHEQAVEKRGYIKSLLWYETEYPRMSTAGILQAAPFSIEGPATEYIAILTPAEKTFDLMWAYLESFELLKDKGILPRDSRFVSFDFIEEDKRFLAWVIS